MSPLRVITVVALALCVAGCGRAPPTPRAMPVRRDPRDLPDRSRARRRRREGPMTRFALAVALAVSSAGAAFAQTQAPGVASPLANLAGLESRPSLPPALPPRADGVPPDLAFGAYQRGNFLYALLEAERRLDGNRTDAAAMTLIGEIYHDGVAVVGDDREASLLVRSRQQSWRSSSRL